MEAHEETESSSWSFGIEGTAVKLESFDIVSQASQRSQQTFCSYGHIEEACIKPIQPDIEHEPVEDDPRLWSPAFKWTLVAILSVGALIPTMAASIFFPVLKDMQTDLHASNSAVALSISLYILAQGTLPLLWSPLSEIYGRRVCFLSSLAIFSITSFIIGAAARDMTTLIVLRVITAGGSSAMLSIAAGTIADLYEPAERGGKVGIYYCCPLLGPALGPIFGGALGSIGKGSWRLTFYFIASLASLSFLSFLFIFKETFRTERSLVWQKAKRKALAENAMNGTVLVQIRRESAPKRFFLRLLRCKSMEKRVAMDSVDSCQADRSGVANVERTKLRPSFSDLSPISSAIAILRQPHNIISLIYSGLGYASYYSICYTATRTFSAAPYSFSPIMIGVVLVAFGVGGMAGSILGGRLSDRALATAASRTGKPSAPEHRIKSVRIPMLLCPPSFIGYAWSAYYKSHIAIPILFLIPLGFSIFWIYASTLSYVIDSNVGRSSNAVACNGVFRGFFAFVASEVAVPLQDTVGDGALYTGWAILLTIAQLALMVVAYKGERWRDPSWRWPSIPTRRTQ